MSISYIIRYLIRFVGIKCFLTTTCLVDFTELDATKFALNIPQETIQNILANLKVKLDLQTDVVAEQYSLNLYRTGGMFKKHKDTPRGDDSECCDSIIFI